MAANQILELKGILERAGLINKNPQTFERRYRESTQNPEVRRFLELETPKVSDLTETLQIENKGRLYAIRFDLNLGVNNHKKQVCAGLILRRILQGRLSGKKDTLIDGGNYNSASALKYYTQMLGLKGVYIMSRLFLQRRDIIDSLESDNFKIEIAPENKSKSLEIEFYDYLYRRMKDPSFSQNKVCLWHAKHSGKAMYPFGIEIAESLKVAPDCIISCLGAGSTLEGTQIAIQDYCLEKKLEKPEILIAEHELSPLFAKLFNFSQAQLPAWLIEEFKDKIKPEEYLEVNGLPHIVIGPHYQEINPLLSRTALSRIDKVIQYSESDWMITRAYLEAKGIYIGNSSAANIAASLELANQGKKVLTVIFEPFRWFYKK